MPPLFVPVFELELNGILNCFVSPVSFIRNQIILQDYHKISTLIRWAGHEGVDPEGNPYLVGTQFRGEKA
jgi:hypothetical protein